MSDAKSHQLEVLRCTAVRSYIIALMYVGPNRYLTQVVTFNGKGNPIVLRSILELDLVMATVDYKKTCAAYGAKED